MNKLKMQLDNRETGFTIIEIMVALAIGALLIGGIIQVFISFKQTEKVAGALSRIQESSRLVNDIFMSDSRHIGFVGCLDPHEAGTGVSVIYKDAPPYITNFRDNSLNGWDITAHSWGDAATIDLGDIDNDANKNAILHSDVFRAQFLSQTSIPLNSDMSSKSDDIELSNNIFGLKDGSIASVGSCDFIDVFKVSGVVAGSPVTISHGDSTNTSTELGVAYSSEDLVRIFLSNTYFVGKSGRKNNSGDEIFALYRRDVNGDIEEIVEGVENMQILYGQEIAVDNNTSNNTIRYVNASDTDIKWEDVTVIKIALLLASSDRVLTTDDTSTYQLLDRTITQATTPLAYPNDRRLRRVVNMNINIRNRRVVK
ncbi:MAG: PilW family protein [Ketobacter sp.]